MFTSFVAARISGNQPPRIPPDPDMVPVAKAQLRPQPIDSRSLCIDIQWMKNRLPFVTLRIALAIGLAICLVSQVVVLPWMSGWVAHDNPDVANMRWPVLVLSILGLVCIEIVLACIWRLLGAVQASQIFDTKLFGWVDGIVWALAAAAGLLFVTFVYLLAAGEGPITVPGSALLATVAALGGTSLMTVMRALLHQATSLRTEVDAII